MGLAIQRKASLRGRKRFGEQVGNQPAEGFAFPALQALEVLENRIVDVECRSHDAR
jgi:hypothetical protein